MIFPFNSDLTTVLEYSRGNSCLMLDSPLTTIYQEPEVAPGSV